MSGDDDHEQGETPGENRRAFLTGALAGAGLAAGAALTPANAQTPAAAPNIAHQAMTMPQNMGDHEGAFFNQQDAMTVATFTERLMPGAPGKPGAMDAGVLNYIDLALAGAYADQQDFYRSGLLALDAYARKTFSADFRRLSPQQQDQIISALEENKATDFTWPSARDFFATLRTHTMEGMFADPVYGGNKNFAGWRLVGFPGAQATFTTEEMTSGKAFARAPIIGLQAQATRKG